MSDTEPTPEEPEPEVPAAALTGDATPPSDTSDPTVAIPPVGEPEPVEPQPEPTILNATVTQDNVTEPGVQRTVTADGETSHGPDDTEQGAAPGGTDVKSILEREDDPETGVPAEAVVSDGEGSVTAE